MGVDVYGRPVDAKPGLYRGAQCKLRTKGDQLGKAEIEHEVSEAHSFPHELDRLVIVTDAPRDTHTQLLVDDISDREVGAGRFAVSIWFWDNVTESLAAHPKLISKYYSDYLTNLTTYPLVPRLVGKPLEALSLAFGHSYDGWHQALMLRGIQVGPLLSKNTEPDGLLLEFACKDDNPTQRILGFAIQAYVSLQQVEATCPAFVLLPPSLHEGFRVHYEAVGGHLDRVQILSSEAPVEAVVSSIFQEVFLYGYRRRGAAPTIEITVRSGPLTPSSALLDLDWTTVLSDGQLPKPEEWQTRVKPALTDIVKQLGKLGDVTRIQVETMLQLPAAFALGFHLNLRFFRIGVWARRPGISDQRSQLWLSDKDGEGGVLDVEWFRHSSGSARSAVLELVTTVSIHEVVKRFADASDISPDVWLQASLSSDNPGINEGIAIAYANQIGALIRSLNSLGVDDIHLFARIPSALAVFIGLRLQACGRIHLYWFINNEYSYQYAFTLG